MSENIRGRKIIEEGEKGDGKCYFPCKICWSVHPVRVLEATTKKHCRRNGHIDGGANEYRHVVIRYIFIICLYIDFIFKVLYYFNICYTH